MAVVLSSSGELHGAGSDPWKWVSFLSKRDLAALDDGDLVVVRSDEPRWTHAGNPAYRIAVRRGRRLVHRVPTGEDRRRIDKVIASLRSDGRQRSS